jgi:hypothetical protein
VKGSCWTVRSSWSPTARIHNQPPLELQATVPDYMALFVTLVEFGRPVFGIETTFRASTIGLAALEFLLLGAVKGR